MHANYTKFNALKYLKKTTTSVPNELTVPSVKQKIYENKKKGKNSSLLWIYRDKNLDASSKLSRSDPSNKNVVNVPRGSS